MKLRSSSRGPKLDWLVEGWIPADDVTLFGADGGTGKTTLALQLGYACQIGWSYWLQLLIKPGPVLYVSAEESLTELHRRLGMIAEHIAGGNPDGRSFGLISCADQDATLARFDHDGTIRPTDLFRDLSNRVVERGVRLLVLDAVADVFGGNENDRSHVRSFVRLLRSLALKARCAILLLSHPSVEGMKTGRGYSGSTHWNNAVRSRLYFTSVATKDGEELDNDLRVLSLEKANRARKGQKIQLRWCDGSFTVEHGAVNSVRELAQAKNLFLELLAQFTAQGLRVGPNSGPNYAPAKFADDPKANGTSRKLLALAMAGLISERKLRAEEHGPPSHRRQYLVAEESQ
jgi:RecA-family ATPase